jgi:hypothetical protein
MLLRNPRLALSAWVCVLTLGLGGRESPGAAPAVAALMCGSVTAPPGNVAARPPAAKTAPAPAVEPAASSVGTASGSGVQRVRRVLPWAAGAGGLAALGARLSWARSRVRPAGRRAMSVVRLRTADAPVAVPAIGPKATAGAADRVPVAASQRASLRKPRL